MRAIISIVTMLGSLFQTPSGSAPKQQQEVVALQARAESGNSDAQVRLGVAYAAGDGVQTDDIQAVKWFRKAAEQGNAAGEYSLAEMYLMGRGVSRDLSEAAEWMRRSAEDGDARGEFNLAVMFAQGQGVTKSDDKAAIWMRKLAEHGLAAGQFGLGSMYAHGRGVPQSVAEAEKWYRKAADQGDLPAMNNLAFLLATSTDSKIRNPKDAIALAQKAVAAEADNPTYLDTLATAYFEAGQPEKAVEAERQVLVLKPDSAQYKKALEKYESASPIKGKHL